MRKLLRQKGSGHIYVWTPQLAQRDDMEPHEQGPQHHILVPAGSLEIVARGTLSVEEPKDTGQVSEADAHQIAQKLFRRKTRKVA